MTKNETEDSGTDGINKEFADQFDDCDLPGDVPDLQQISLTVCSLFLSELMAANQKYPSFFGSSREALGVIRAQYLDAEQSLLHVKSLNGYALDEDSLAYGDELKIDLIQLGAMCIKAAYSLTNLQDDAEKFSATVRQQQEMAEMINSQ